jgi:hypothetical protein
MIRLLVLCMLFHTSASKIIPLESGSFEDQTYGKDGVVLLYDNLSEIQLMHFIDAAKKFENETINFWHLNCDFAKDFCANRPEISDINVPAMLYSFRNELWKGQGCKTYKSHAFETFFQTKVHETCLNTPSLCTNAMKKVLENYMDKNHSVVSLEYLREKKYGDFVEDEWKKVSDEIQNNFFRKRIEYQQKLHESDERLKILGLLMEKLHSESYEENEGEVQEVVIDMRENY